MPNWCQNELTVIGPKEDIAAFKIKAANDKGVFVFNQFVPKPPEVEATPYDKVGYNWERENWGVKWGASEENLITDKPNQLLYTFNTPWGPPELFLIKLSKQYPLLQFINAWIEEDERKHYTNYYVYGHPLTKAEFLNLTKKIKSQDISTTLDLLDI
jgi:hypothetical protein